MDLFERLLTKSNDLGLYAEETVPADGALLGNFPQASRKRASVPGRMPLRTLAGAGVLVGLGAAFGWAASRRRSVIRGKD